MAETRPRRLSGLLLAAGLLSATCPAGEAVRIAEDAIQPQAAVDGGGTIHAVFIHRGNITVSSSKDGGATFSAPVTAIDAGGEARGGAQRGPRIGVDSKGRLYVTCPVVLDPAELEKKYPTPELCLVSSSDGGRTWTKPVRLNEVEKQAPEALHWMAVEPSGTVHAAWLDRREYRAGEPGQDIVYTSIREGKVARNEVVVKDVCECCAPGLAVSAPGVVDIAYREGGAKPSREIFKRTLGLGDGRYGRFGKRTQLNREPSRLTSCPMSAPALAISRDGKRFAAAWMDEASGDRDARLLFIGLGKEPVPIEALGDRSGRQDHPALVFDENGTLWTAWEDGDRGKSRVLCRRDREKPQEASSSADGSAEFPALAAGKGLVVLVYEASKDGDNSVHCSVLRRPEEASRSPRED